jgi:hypothetical protein
MVEYDNRNRGALFRNEQKDGENDRDYSGTLNVGGVEYWLSGWVKTSKKGVKFLSLVVKPKDVEKEKSHAEPFSGEIPF